MTLRSLIFSRLRAFAGMSILFGAFAGAAGQHLDFEQKTTVTGPVFCQPYASISDAQGNVYVTGMAESKVLTEKFSPNGALVYRNEFDMPPAAECIPQTLAQDTTTGDTVVGGYFYDDSGDSQGTFLISITSGGTTRWQTVDKGCTSIDQMVVGPSGNLLVMAEGGTSENALEKLCKYQGSTGAKLLTKTLPLGSGLYSAMCPSLVQDGSGHLYAIVDYETSIGELSIAARYDETTGATVWTNSVGGMQLLDLPNGNIAVFDYATIGNSYQLDLFATVLSASTGTQVESIAAPLDPLAFDLSSLQVIADSTGAMYFSVGLLTETSVIDASLFQVGKLTPSGAVSYLNTLSDAVSAPSIQAGPSGEMFMAYVGMHDSKTVIAALNADGDPVWEHYSPVYPGNPTLLSSGGKLSVAGCTYSFGYAFDVATSIGIGFTDYYPYFSQGYDMVALNPTDGAVTARVSDDPIDAQDNPVYAGCADQSGNYYTFEEGYQGLVVRKRSGDGTILWNTALNPAGTNFAGNPFSIQWTPDGRVTVAFSTPSSTGSVFNAGLASLNSSTGAVYWDQVYSGPSGAGYGLEYMNCDSSSGHIVIAGVSDLSYAGLATQFDEQTGARVWEYINPAEMTSFAGDASGGTVMCGLDSTFTGYQVARIDSTGKQIYNRDIPVPVNDSSELFFSDLAMGLACDPAGDAYVGYWDFNSVNLHLDVFSESGTPVTKSGNDVLASQGSGIGYAYAPTLAFDGTRQELYVVVDMLTTTGANVKTLQLSPKGVPLWSNTLATGKFNYLQTAALDSEGNLIILGEVFDENVGYSTIQNWLRKLTPEGKVKYQYTYKGSLSSPYDNLYGLTFGVDNDPFVFGGCPSDGGFGSDSSLVFKVAENVAPACVNSSFAAAAGSLTTIEAPGVLAGGSNLEGAAAVLVSPPLHAGSFTLNSDGSFEYDPLPGYKGKDSFTFQADNSYGKSNIATVTVTVS